MNGQSQNFHTANNIDYPDDVPPPKTYKKAMTLGMTALCLFWTTLPAVVLGILAIVFGIKHFKKARNYSLSGIITGAIALLLSAVLTLFMSNFITDVYKYRHSAKQYTVEQAASMFYTNEHTFTDVAQSILYNNALRQNVLSNFHATLATSTPAIEFDVNFPPNSIWEKYFSTDDWNRLMQFLQNTKPAGIEYCLLDGTPITFSYNHLSYESGIMFFYYPKANATTTHESQWFTHFNKLDDHWYMAYGYRPFKPARTNLHRRE